MTQPYAMPSPINKNILSKFIKIEDQSFETEMINVQLSMGARASISVKFDIKKHPGYYSFFIRKYEDQSNASMFGGTVGSGKFDLYHKKFVSRGTMIKSMDVSFDDEMNLSLICDLLDEYNIQEIREDIINDLLGGKTLPKDDNIT